jgi:phosphohistidine phosphatase
MASPTRTSRHETLFRHGPAAKRNPQRWPDDARRPLTARGQKRTRAAGRGLWRLLAADGVRVVTSPLARSACTAELLGECHGGMVAVEESALLAPGSPFGPIIEMLQECKAGETMILVGHEPDLGKLAGTLLFGAPHPLPLRKAGACVLSFVGPVEAGKATLHGFYPARVLRKIGGRKVRA